MTATQSTPPRVLTPTVGTTARRAAFWVIAVVVALLIALAGVLLAGSGEQGARLAPDSPAPEGGQAVAEVLRQQGVDVVATSTLEQTRSAGSQASIGTLLLVDDGYLDSDQRQELLGLADRIVVVDPSFEELQDLAPGVGSAGFAQGPFEADCDVAAVEAAGRVTGDASGYRLLDGADGTECLGSGDDVFSLVEVETDGTRVTVLGADEALTNGEVGTAGNAALALNLLGEAETLVWYLPSIADVSGTSIPTITELTPEWVTPALVLLALAAVAAAVWRGRRFGPLVIENLPVTVRASETMEGRARLYERNAARVRALDALRVGTVSRLASALGLPRTATVADVTTGAAELTGRARAALADLLLHAEPGTDSDLVRLSDELLVLEREVAARLDPRQEE